jgi:enoyl-CoA hydratase/carnithine racemase
MAPVAPTDEELNTMIRARLASVGIDLDQLPETEPDTETVRPAGAACSRRCAASCARRCRQLPRISFRRPPGPIPPKLPSSRSRARRRRCTRRSSPPGTPNERAHRPAGLPGPDVAPEVAVATLNRPEAANALNPRLLADLAATIDRVSAEESATVLVVAAAGRHFCAGADLKERDDEGQLLAKIRDTLEHVARLRLLTIAAIDGSCMGGGLELALACDLRIVGRSARLGLPEIQFGALPAAGGPARLARLVGPAHAKLLVCTGQPVTGEEGARLGLVTHAVDDGTAVAEALDLADRLARHAGYALRTAKAIIDGGQDVALAAALTAEYQAIDAMASPEELHDEMRRAMERSATYSKIFTKGG